MVEAAHQVLQIAELSRPDNGTSVTPTVAKAGSADNVVPAEATIHVDVRIETADERGRIESAFAALTPECEGASLSVRGGIGRPPMPESASAALFATAQRLLPGLESRRSAVEATATSPPPWESRRWMDSAPPEEGHMLTTSMC